MRGLQLDVKNAIRSLLWRPGFTLMLILTLGLGIGATTTVWSFAYALLLRPYPYEAPDALVRVQSVYTKEGGARRGMSLLDLQDYRRHSTKLAAIGAYTVFDMRLLSDGPAIVVSAANLSPDGLSLLGVTPAMGRLLEPADDVPGGDVNKAVISHTVWQSVFGGDPAVVGKPLRTDRHPYTVVGVMPPGFAFPERVGVWMPLESWYSNLPANDDRRNKWRGERWYPTVARLAAGITPAQAQADLNSIAATLERDYPVATSYYIVRTESDPASLLPTIRRTIADTDRTIAVTSVKTLERTMTESLWQRRLWGVLFTAFAALALVLAAVGIYGVISYAVAQRTHEMGVRLALGATPGEVRRLVVREGMTLCTIGALAGVAGAFAAARFASSLLFDVQAHDGLTYSLVLVTIAITGLAACWVPALRASRLDPTIALRVE